MGINHKVQREILLDRLAFYLHPDRDQKYKDYKKQVVVPRIFEALRRIDDGTYGCCARCNQDIDSRRLELVPAALYCVDCQEREEERVKRTRLK